MLGVSEALVTGTKAFRECPQRASIYFESLRPSKTDRNGVPVELKSNEHAFGSRLDFKCEFFLIHGREEEGFRQFGSLQQTGANSGHLWVARALKK